MAKEKDYYKLLGIPHNATDFEIKAAYRRLAKDCHPDKNSSKKSTEIFQELNNAYRTLIDHVSRAIYDVSQGYKTSEATPEDCSESYSAAGVCWRENLESFTMDLPIELYMVWVTVCQQFYKECMYEPLINREANFNGLQLKFAFMGEDDTPCGSVSLTFYKTTARVLVQGSSYLLWHSEHMGILTLLVDTEFQKKQQYWLKMAQEQRIGENRKDKGKQKKYVRRVEGY